MTATQKVTALKNAGFTNRDIIEMVKEGTINEMAELAS